MASIDDRFLIIKNRQLIVTQTNLNRMLTSTSPKILTTGLLMMNHGGKKMCSVLEVDCSDCYFRPRYSPATLRGASGV